MFKHWFFVCSRGQAMPVESCDRTARSVSAIGAYSAAARVSFHCTTAVTRVVASVMLQSAMHARRALRIRPRKGRSAIGWLNQLILHQLVDQLGQHAFETGLRIVFGVLESIDRNFRTFLVILEYLDDEDLFFAGTAMHRGAIAVAEVEKFSNNDFSLNSLIEK